LPPFALTQSAADRHTTQAGDFHDLLDASAAPLPSHDPSEQTPTSLIQLGHHTIDGAMVFNQFGIAARSASSTAAPIDSLAILVCHDHVSILGNGMRKLYKRLSYL